MQSPIEESVPYLVHPRPASWGSAVIAETGKTVLRPVASTAFNDPAFSGVEGLGGVTGYTAATANKVNNYQYATNGPHPSDIVVGQEGTYEIRMDQTFVVAASNAAAVVAASAYAKTVEGAPYTAEYTKRGYTGHGNGQKFGYGTCHWLRACTATEYVGTSCTATHGTTVFSGFCFRSDTGSLECGAMTAIDDEYGESPVTLGHQMDQESLAAGAGAAISGRVALGDSQNTFPGQVGLTASSSAYAGTIAHKAGTFRCPTGSPAKSLGYFVSKRLLIAGCMIATDANFDSIAEVHVPAYCATPADYMVGCLFAGATNYDPTAKQSGECFYHTTGCMTQNSVNYNPRATTADSSCIAMVPGCPVNPVQYAGKTTGTAHTPDNHIGTSCPDR